MCLLETLDPTCGCLFLSSLVLRLMGFPPLSAETPVLGEQWWVLESLSFSSTGPFPNLLSFSNSTPFLCCPRLRSGGCFQLLLPTWFLNFSILCDPLEGLLQHRLLELSPGFLIHKLRLGLDVRICISNKFPVDAYDTGLVTIIWKMIALVFSFCPFHSSTPNEQFFKLNYLCWNHWWNFSSLDPNTVTKEKLCHVGDIVVWP